MTENELLEKLGSLLQQPGPIPANALLKEMDEWDSLAMISTVALFKNVVGKPIPFTVVSEAKTPADLIAFCKC